MHQFSLSAVVSIIYHGPKLAIAHKSTNFQIFESQENVWLIFYIKQLESDKTKSMAELALPSRFS